MLTFAHVASLGVYAATPILAGVLSAFIYIFIAVFSLPARSTAAGIRSVICRRDADSSLLTWMGSTGNLLHFTVFSCEWWITVARVTVDSILTSALVQTRP